MRPRALWLAVALLGAAARPATADVADYLGKPVASLRVEVEGRRVDEPRLLGLIETRVGAPLSMSLVRESITHLMALGRYEDVRVSADLVDGALRLTYDVVPVHPIEEIVFSGPFDLPGMDEGRLRRAVVDRFGVSPPAGRRFDLARIVEDDLRQHGYLRAAIVPSVEIMHAPDRARLVFAIQPGVRTTVAHVDVGGTPGVPAAELVEKLRLVAGMAFERDAINLRLQEFQRSQWAAGYVEAKLSLVTRFAEDDRTVDLLITAVRGPRVRVVFQGDSIPRDKRDELVPVAAEASADEDLLEDSSNRIEEYLRGLGYRDATAPHTRVETDGELAVTFTIARGPLYRVSDVAISGNRFESFALLQPRLSVRKGQPFSGASLDADVSAIEDAYRRQGFAGARVETAVEPVPAAAGSEVPVLVRLTIAEGTRTVVASVRVRGNASVAEADLLQGLGLQPGRPFFLTQMAIDRDAIQLQYANRGYQSTTVDGNPGATSDGGLANVVFTVQEGPQLIVDHVLVVGNVRTRTETIERELQLKTGDPLGLAAVVETQRRLAELGLFRRVRITQVPHGDENRRDLVVSVEESPVTTIGYGGGLEALQLIQTEASGAAVERLSLAPRAFFEIGRRNLFGKNRSINLFTRLSLRPDPAQATADSSLGFREYRIFGAFREPRLFNTAADAFLSGTVEQQGRSSFSFSRRAFNAEIGRRLTPRPSAPGTQAADVSLSGNYQIQRTDLFDEHIAEEDKLLVDRLFPQIVLSSFSLSGVRTTRDDAVNPTRGGYLSANGQVAARHIGSEVGFFKSYLTAQFFRPLPRARGTVLATSARLGAAYGFPRSVVQSDASGDPIVSASGVTSTQVVRDLPVSERFFAGGDTTVRGFALDQLGAASTLDKNGLALGGNAVVILNVELRVPIRGSLGMVGFLDAGNVFARTSDIDLAELRSAVGFGLRYRSPIGPIRVDVGYKTRRHEVVPGRFESGNAIHISLGQAF